MIGVKNKSGTKVVARYDGKDYVFDADEKVTSPISEEAARHIFGWGEDDKKRALLRLGWLPNGGALEDGLKKLDEFLFLEVEVKFKEESTTLELPRKVADNAPQEKVGLSEGEKALIPGLMQKPGEANQKFAHQKK